MFVRQQRLATRRGKVFANGIKVHHLRKAIWGVELEGRRSLGKRKLLLVGLSFVSGQDQHAAVARLGKSFESGERPRRKQNRCWGKMRAVVFENAVPAGIGVTVRRLGNVAIR